MTIHIPTPQDYAAYRGEHCFALWRRVGPAWICPACRRTRFEIMRWTQRQARPGNGHPLPFKGWMAGLHTHHDHAAEVDGFYRPELARFAEDVICDQCNASDGRAKVALCLPRRWSFSPSEIGRFVEATPHARHHIRLDVALTIFKGAIEAGVLQP